MKKILVFGATGDQGIPLLNRLLDAGYEVVGAARSVPAEPEVTHPNLRWAAADWDQPDTLLPLTEECDAICMHLPFVFDEAYAKNMGEAICKAAVAGNMEKIIFHTSCYVADRDLDLSAHDGRRRIEEAMEASGIPFAVIRSAVFMDNLQRAWLKPAIVNSGIFAYPAGEKLQISFVCLDDIAAYMVAALSNPEVTADKFMVGGPEPLLGSQVAEKLTKVLGKEITFQSLTPDTFAENMAFLVTGSRDVEPLSIYDGMAQFYRFYNGEPVSPLIVDLAPVLEKLDVTPTDFETWAARQDWTL